MEREAADDPTLKSFRAALDQIYGDRLQRVILFGSRARGDARQESDYDIAVFLEPLADRWAELDRLSNLGVDFLEKTGVFFDAALILLKLIGAPARLCMKSGAKVSIFESAIRAVSE